MLQRINNAEVILGAGEAVAFECGMMNALIGARAPDVVIALAEVVSGADNESDEKRFVSLEVEYEGKEYTVFTAGGEMGVRAIISYKGSENEFDPNAFLEYKRMLKEFSKNSANVFRNTKMPCFDSLLSNGEITFKNYEEWLALIKGREMREDGRPVFLINFLEHFVEAERALMIEELKGLGRQIFISATRDLFDGSFDGVKVEVERAFTVI